MGSSYFYLEFLLALVSLLRSDAGYRNPALFALEYTLVPDASFPTQLRESIAGYEHVRSIVDSASRICLSGDSAGATLVLSLLLHIAKSPYHEKRRPGYAILISPWVSIVSPNNRNTPSDYLNESSLELYGRQYAGSEAYLRNPFVSPGICKDSEWWSKASPSAGLSVLYGSDEVLGPETRTLITLLRKSGCCVSVREDPGGIHAWPVATLFLSDTQEERQKGIRAISKMIQENIKV